MEIEGDDEGVGLMKLEMDLKSLCDELVQVQV